MTAVRRWSLRWGSFVLPSGLLALVVLFAAPAGAYTIQNQNLSVRAEASVEAVDCSGGSCHFMVDFDEDADEVSGLGPLLATATAIAEIPNAQGGPARITATTIGSSTLDPEEIRVSIEFSSLSKGPGMPFDDPLGELWYDVTFTVDAPTAYLLIGGAELWGPGVGEYIEESEGILAPGTYTLVTYLAAYVGGTTDYVSLTLVPVPEPGTALLLGLGFAALARGARRAA